MYLHAIYTQMEPEQQGQWMEQAYQYTVIGTYAQTELGHGRLGCHHL